MQSIMRDKESLVFHQYRDDFSALANKEKVEYFLLLMPGQPLRKQPTER